MATIVLSSTLTQYARQQSKFEITGKTLFGVLLNMIQTYPHLRPHLFDVHGDLTNTMNFYLNEETIMTKHWHNIPIKNSDTISILLAGRRTEKTPELVPQVIPERNARPDRVKLVNGCFS